MSLLVKQVSKFTGTNPRVRSKPRLTLSAASHGERKPQSTHLLPGLNHLLMRTSEREDWSELAGTASALGTSSADSCYLPVPQLPRLMPTRQAPPAQE